MSASEWLRDLGMNSSGAEVMHANPVNSARTRVSEHANSLIKRQDARTRIRLAYNEVFDFLGTETELLGEMIELNPVLQFAKVSYKGHVYFVDFGLTNRQIIPSLQVGLKVAFTVKRNGGQSVIAGIQRIIPLGEHSSEN